MKTLATICLLLVAATAQAALITAINVDWLSETQEPPVEFRFATGPNAYLSYTPDPDVSFVNQLADSTPDLISLVADLTNGTPDTVALTGGFGAYQRSEAFFTEPANAIETDDGEIRRWHSLYRTGNGIDWHGLVIEYFRLAGGDMRLVGNGAPWPAGSYRGNVSLKIYGRIPEPATACLLLLAITLLPTHCRRSDTVR